MVDHVRVQQGQGVVHATGQYRIPLFDDPAMHFSGIHGRVPLLRRVKRGHPQFLSRQ
jgi:hypothetical protein